MAEIWEDRFIDVDGVKTHYIESGAGDTVVLIHGGGESSCAEINYGDIMGPLGRNFHVIAPDCAGFGLTRPRGSQDYPAEAQGAFLVSFLRALGIARAHAGGNSHGGWLCQYVAHEAPDIVKSLIVINSLNGTAPIPPEPDGLKYIYGPKGHSHQPPTQESVRRHLLRFYFNKGLVTEERVKRTLEISLLNVDFSRERARATSSTVEDSNKNLSYRGKHISEHAGNLRIPVLMTWSRENTGSTPAQATAFFNRIKDVEMHVFANAGHHVMTEHPQRWSEVVTDFIRART